MTTIQINDPNTNADANYNDNNKKKNSRRHGLQTEIWYPTAAAKANKQKPNNIDMNTNTYTKYCDYLGLETAINKEEALNIANSPSAIGGYREGLTIEELDDPKNQKTTGWVTDAIRDATILEPPSSSSLEEEDKEDKEKNDKIKKWPLIIFSHGSGAYRASYSFWTECLASHGYVVVADRKSVV